MKRDWTSGHIAELFHTLESHTEAAVELRQQLHAEPRVSGDEDDTTTALTEAIGLPNELLPTGGAILRIGAPDGPAVGLRAELDALPVEERTDVPWRSTNGAMHACGHDVHMAAAFAVARTLHEKGAPAPLVLVLQPREETLPSGAKDVTTSPAFTRHDVRAFIGAHVQPRLRPGYFTATPGAVNAAADQFTVVVHGRPGHAAYPHLTADPVVAAADLIGTLQHFISRQVDPTNPTVLSIGSINGGNSPNVVPAKVQMKGILRTFDEDDRVRLHKALSTASQAVVDVHGCDADAEVSLGAPVLVNDPELATMAALWVERAGLLPAPALRSCGADDFSYFCDLYPSLMVFVGVGSDQADDPGLHHPSFLPPDRAVGDVAKAMLASYLGGCAAITELPEPDE